MSRLPEAILWFHIATGGFALLAGVFTLLFTIKGTSLHVRAGKTFWYSMTAMATSGIVVAILRPRAVFILIGVLSLYLINTGRNALTRAGGIVNHDTKFWFVIAVSCLVSGLVLGIWGLVADERIFGSPYTLYLGVAFDAAIFVVLDWRLIAKGGATGKSRLIDHLWRMIAGLFFAMFALFVANPSVFPEWFTGPGFNFVPPFAVLAAIVYWVVAVQRQTWKRS